MLPHENPRSENHEPPKTGIPNRKKPGLNTALTCKLDYFKPPTSPSAATDSEFFTGDYSPELNPVENVWEYLRKNKLALRIHDRYEDIVDACCKAWTDLIADPARLMSITARNWANVS